MDELYGVMNASPEKRYKNFISKVTDNEEVWVLDNGEGYATLVQNDYISLIVYPSKEAAEFFSEGDEVMSIEVHDFVNNCEETLEDSSFRFAVYPNGKDAFIVSTQQMLEDLLEELDLIE